MKMKGKLRCHIKRQVSVILTLAMLLTMIPTTGFAVESSGNIPVEEGKASPSNVAVGQKDDRVQAKATDADADIDLENDLDLATPGDAISLSEEALTFIASVEELDQEYLMRLIDDYAEAWKAYHSMAAKEDVEEAELARAEEACIAAENALLEAYDEAELYRLYGLIPEAEKAYKSVADAYEKLESINGTYQKVMQELRGISTYTKQGYNQVVSVYGVGFTQKIVEKGTSLEDAMKLLPEQVNVHLGDGNGNTDPNPTALDVTWEIKDGQTYDGTTEGSYQFLMQLPDGYSWGQWASPLSLYITVVDAEQKEICFWLDSEVDNFDNLIFDVRGESDPYMFATFVEKGIGNKGGKQCQYLKFKLYQNVRYSYICRPYEYQWTGNSLVGGTSEVTISLTKLPYCTVQFEVRNETGDPVPDASITVANAGDSAKIISPEDIAGTTYHVPVQSQSPAMVDNNFITYTIQAPEHAPLNGRHNFTIADKESTISIPIVLSKKKTVEEVYDQNWDYTADELEIGTPEELAAYSYWSNKEKDVFKNKRIVLTDDIDISGIRWKPISCDPDASIIGSFNGQGYTVTMDVVELHNNQYNFGGLFGFVTGSSIENLNVDGNIRISGSVRFAFIGGVAGALVDDNAIIRNCFSNVDITFIDTPEASYIGGIVGQIGSAELEHCSYDGDIHIGSGNATYTGGIAGSIASGGSVQHASSSGSIVFDNGNANCGGIAGYMSADTSRITGCSSDMDITAVLGYFGGIVGYNVYGSVSNAYFNGSVEKSNGDLLPAFGQKRDTATFESCGYAEGSGHNDNGIPGVTCITADMTPDEVLNALNTAGELPWFTYVGGEPVLISLPEEAVVTRGLDGVRYVQEGDTISFTVSAASPDGGNLIYQWQKDGKDIELGDNPGYSIPVVASDSGGIYSVTVKNQNPRGEISDGADGGSCQLIVVKKGDIQIASGGYQGGWTKDPVTFELSGGLSDYLLGYEYLSTGAGEKPGAADTRWSLCEGALRNTVTASGEGESYYWFRTRNQAGETGDAEGPVRVRIDRTAPILAPLVVTENEPDTEQAVIRLRASDAMSGVKEIHYLVRNVEEAAPSSGQIQTGTSCQPGDVRITGLSAGSSYRIYAVASDLAGNISEIQSVEVKKEKSTEEPVRPVRSSEEADSNTGSWVGANGSTGYIKPDGSRCRSEWYLIHGEWYYFDENGRMLIGWYFDPAYQAWFYLKPDGAMAVGWIRLPDGKWYYLNPVSDGRRGAMYADAWIDGYYLGKDGAWIP